jgi:hypothetical protein
MRPGFSSWKEIISGEGEARTELFFFLLAEEILSCLFLLQCTLFFSPSSSSFHV